MKVMHKKRLAVAMTGAFACASLFTGVGLLNASAADPYFTYGGLEGRTYISGVEKQDIIDAFEAEAARLSQEMSEAGYDSGFTLRDGNSNPLSNGWPDNGASTYNVYAMLRLGEFDQTSHAWESDDCFMVFNPHTKEVYSVRGEGLSIWLDTNNGWNKQTYFAGYPVGNQFTVGEIDYQNFGLGYSKGTNGTAEFVRGKKIDANGEESNLTVDDIVKGMIIPVYQDNVNAADIAGLSVADYEAAYKAYYAEKDINANFIRQNNNNKHSQWRQETAEGGNVVYNAKLKKMYTVTSTFLTAFNASGDWGAPIGEESVIAEKTNQLYTNGVAVVEEDEIKFYKASHVDPDTGDIVSDLEGDAAGKVDAETEAKLPSGVTAEAVKAAGAAVYTQDMGNAIEFMHFFEETDHLVQTFVKGEGDTAETTKIYVDTKKSPLAAVVLDKDAFKLYENPTRFNEGNQLYPVTGEMILGPAISNAFEANGTKYQNFLYGAINLTETKVEKQVLPGVNYSADGTRTVLDLSEYITIKPNEIRIPDSYNVGAADLLAKFKAAYKEYAEQGIALGMPNVEGIGSWAAVANGQEVGTNEFIDGQGMIKLGLHMTDSNAICYYGVTAMLGYSPKDGKVYIMKDSVISNMATYYCFFGAPTSNLTETTLQADGQEVSVWIQNFELGYLVVMGDSASMINDKIWDFDLRGPVNLDGTKIPGVEYPGESGTNPGGNEGDDNKGDGKKGCGSVGSTAAGLIAGGIAIACAATVLVSKKRKEN